MWASLAHAVILLNVLGLFMGTAVIFTMGIWLFKRRTSEYIGFQALQAFIFQSASVFLAIMLGALLPPLFVIVMLPASLYAMYGAYRCNKGQEFQYIFIGDLITSLKSRDK